MLAPCTGLAALLLPSPVDVSLPAGVVCRNRWSVLEEEEEEDRNTNRECGRGEQQSNRQASGSKLGDGEKSKGRERYNILSEDALVQDGETAYSSMMITDVTAGKSLSSLSDSTVSPPACDIVPDFLSSPPPCSQASPESFCLDLSLLSGVERKNYRKGREEKRRESKRAGVTSRESQPDQPGEAEGSVASETEWEVVQVLDTCINKGEQREYYVDWGPAFSHSWESADNLKHSEELRRAFWRERRKVAERKVLATIRARDGRVKIVILNVASLKAREEDGSLTRWLSDIDCDIVILIETSEVMRDVSYEGWMGKNFSHRKWYRRQLGTHKAAHDRELKTGGVCVLVQEEK
uniref:Chromo domain-containing protein n=1 Tax=Chromera velia CCMP2878 TaxID=1169474 RepID=A0A0G4FXR5_9ALVE|eukprot:Cvel_19213.t1-p1 / transcript=Cvel_19213.t1 / gene=Cvel_19213 / organism=Chromera_velia_CCMP2878 / gene_product=hypothetical protein / transcript_product=hypothetical protein / location=Cvel_scaffold1641:5543-8051(-) / protein_length=350 / sequence_SO=supercontig / SO=protein_coding / is_pseudo=false